jgi:hypothetical protein
MAAIIATKAFLLRRPSARIGAGRILSEKVSKGVLIMLCIVSPKSTCNFSGQRRVGMDRFSSLTYTALDHDFQHFSIRVISVMEYRVSTCIRSFPLVKVYPVVDT